MTSNIYIFLTYLRPHKSVKPNGKKVITKIYTNCYILPFFAFLGKFKIGGKAACGFISFLYYFSVLSLFRKPSITAGTVTAIFGVRSLVQSHLWR